MLDHAFAGGPTEVWAVMFPANAPSRGVMSRLGMTDLGVHERWYPGESQAMRITAVGVVPGSTLRELRGRPPGRLQQFP